MFNADNKVLYASYSADSLEIYYFYNPELLKRVRERKYVETTRDSLDVVGVMYTDEEKGSLW